MVAIGTAFLVKSESVWAFWLGDFGSIIRKISTAGRCLRGLCSTLSFGSVKVRTTSLPCCEAARSVTATGVGAFRSVGSPGAPQPVRNEKAKTEKRKYKTVAARQSISKLARSAGYF